MEVMLRKVPGGFQADSDEVREQIKSIKTGAGVRCKITQPRNAAFHRKFHAMCRLAFDYWEEPENPEFEKWEPQKNYERFWRDLVILAGFHETSWRVDGTARVEAAHTNFAAMGEDRFLEVYNKVLDVIFDRIAIAESKEELNNMIDQFQEFQ